jgi:hypothetical protein
VHSRRTREGWVWDCTIRNVRLVPMVRQAVLMT